MRDRPSLILIRHAQSQNNALDESLRVPDPHITELGVQQAQRLAEAVARIKPTVVYCSPFQRSLQTTHWAVRKTGLTPFVQQDLYEQGGCHSGFEPGKRLAQPGMTRAELKEQFPGWGLDQRITQEGWYDLDHYETLREARQRADKVRHWFENDSDSHTLRDRVAMIIHADFKVRLLESFLERPDIEESLGDVVNTAITQLSLSNGKWKLDYWNVFEHLDDELVTT